MLEDFQLKDAILLVFANKMDLGDARPVQDLVDALRLRTTKRSREWYLQACCATTGDGLYEGLDWLAGRLAARQAETSSWARLFQFL
mmetsp:Transcript_1123/g.4444  ORF Transcript_1123/g.4444 Transcript_1123/m.4444 type:complete len:87 (+) Transcript_1123:581-841(+)